MAHMVYAYNCTKHASTGYAPLKLMCGRALRLPIDISIEKTEENESGSYSSFNTAAFRKRLTAAYELATKYIEKAQETIHMMYKLGQLYWK